MKKKLLVLLVTSLFMLIGCEDIGFNRNMLEYLEFYSSTAVLMKHEFQTTTHSDSQGNITVPSDKDAVVTLYTTNPKDYTLHPDFTPTTTANLTSGTQPNYGIDIKHNPQDKMLYTATIPQSLLRELDLQDNLDNRSLTLTIKPVETVSQRPMPEYSFTIHSNTKPEFGGTKQAIIMETKENFEGSRKWVLAFELPDLKDVHKDIVALEINGTRYTINPSAGQGVLSLASMGNKLVNESETLSISTESTTYGKEITSFKFEKSKNAKAFEDAGITGDQVGTISMVILVSQLYLVVWI